MRPVYSRFPVTLGYRQKMKSRPTYIHRGVDYGCPTGTRVRATIGGKVVFAGQGGLGAAFGVHVVILTGSILHVYAHLSKAKVKRGRKVRIGQTIGRSGATGNVTGDHLHYGELRTWNYLDDRRPEFLGVEKPAKQPHRAAYLVNRPARGRTTPGGRIVKTRRPGSSFTSRWRRRDHLGRWWLRTRLDPLWYLEADFIRKELNQ